MRAMSEEQDPAAVARAIVDANRYMTLGTADASGLPWVSPVWYAAAGYREFFWASGPDARHSRNVAERPQVGIVIFDSQAPLGAAQAVYVAASAEVLAGAGLDRGIDVFSRESVAQGARVWEVVDEHGHVAAAAGERDEPPARRLRLYRAAASELSILDPAATVDRRLRVTE